MLIAYRLKSLLLATLVLASCSRLPLQEGPPKGSEEDGSSVGVEQLEPAPGSGIVVGALHISAEAASKPVPNTILYLAETLDDAEGQEAIAAMDRVRSPKSITDEQGGFVFRDVPPGRYALVLDAIVNSYMLMHPGTQDPLLVQVSDGEVLDMENLVYDQLPIAVP